MSFIKEYKDGSMIRVYVTPKSNKTEIKGEREERLWLRIASVPEGGKANKEVIKLMSKVLKIASSKIEIESGKTSRRKSIYVSEMKPNLIMEKLEII